MPSEKLNLMAKLREALFPPRFTFMGRDYDARKYMKVPDPSDTPPPDWKGPWAPDMMVVRRKDRE